jgi:hypothetical protein
MRFYSSAYLAYAIRIPDTETDTVETALQSLNNGVSYLTAGRFDEQQTYLTTECHGVDAGGFLTVAPETLSHRPELDAWDAALKAAAGLLGHTDTTAPAWLLIADLDN